MKTEKCHLCNEPINLHQYELYRAIPKIMEAKQLCFHCAFWQSIKEEDDKVRKDSSMERKLSH
jgi:hypothetical protein